MGSEDTSMAQTRPYGKFAVGFWGGLIPVNQSDLRPLDFENSKEEYTLGSDASNDIVLKGAGISTLRGARSDTCLQLHAVKGKSTAHFRSRVPRTVLMMSWLRICLPLAHT
jgi:hypothetical protein